MDRRLIRDLERWERGELHLGAIETTHGVRARSLAELHGRLGALGAGPVPPADAAWAELAPQLSPRGEVVPIARRLPRALVAAAAAAAVALALGMATPNPARHQLLSFFDRVRSALGLEGSGPGAPLAPGPPIPSGSPGIGTGLPVAPEDEAEAVQPVSGDADDEADEGETLRGDGDADDQEAEDGSAQGDEDRDAGEDADEDGKADEDGDVDRLMQRDGNQDTDRDAADLDRQGDQGEGNQGDG